MSQELLTLTALTQRIERLEKQNSSLRHLIIFSIILFGIGLFLWNFWEGNPVLAENAKKVQTVEADTVIARKIIADEIVARGYQLTIQAKKITAEEIVVPKITTEEIKPRNTTITIKGKTILGG